MAKAVIYTDGGARGNPGSAGIGYVIFDELQSKIILDHATYIGETTNNFAEYTALIRALEAAKKLGVDEATCYLDSELVVKQLLGKYKVRESTLQPLVAEVLSLIKDFKQIEFIHVPRDKNKLADKLVNQALDDYIKPA